MHRELQLLAHRPHRVVAVARVRLVAAPPRRDDDPAGRGPRRARARISAMAPSMSSRIGRDDQPGAALGAVAGTARRPTGCTHARRRAGDRGRLVATGLKPAPNGAPMLPVAASGPGNTTSAATPSLSSSLSRVAASQPPRSPISWRLLPSSSSPNHSSWNSSSPTKFVLPAPARRSSMRRCRSASSSSKSSRYCGSRIVAVHG